MSCFYQFCPCQDVRPSLTEEGIKRGCKMRDLDELRQTYSQKVGFMVIELWACEL